MKLTLLLFILFLFFLPTDAQTQFEQWHKETIYLHSSGYVKEGKKYGRGFFNRNLKKELQDSPIAALEFKKAQKSMITSVTLSALSVASVLVGTQQIRKGKDSNAAGFLVGGLVLSLGSLPFSLRANNQIHRAVWMHNGDLVIPKEK